MAKQQIQPQQPKLKVLYDQLVKDNYDVPTDYESFERNLSDDKKSQTLFESLRKDNYDVPGEYDSFARNLSVGSYSKKKDSVGSSVSSATGSPISPEHNFVVPTPDAKDLPEIGRKMAEAFNSKPLPPGAPTPTNIARRYLDELNNPDLNKEDNPLITAGKTVWNLASKQIPADVAGAASMLTEGLYQAAIAEQGGASLKSPTDIKNETTETIRKDIVDWAIDKRLKSAQEMKNLTTSLDQVHDPIDALNWISGTIAESAVQIPAAVATGGASSIGQEVGSIYLDGVQQIAESRGITPAQVLEQGLDEPAFAVTWGTTAGLLDRLGAGKVMGSFTKEAMKKGLRARAMEMVKTGAMEGSTEYAQTFLEQLGSSQVGGKSFGEAWEEAQTSDAVRNRLEALAKGVVGGAGIHAIGSAMSRPEQSIQAPAGDLGAQPVSAPVEQPVAEPVTQNVAPEPVTPGPAVKVPQEPEPAPVEAEKPAVELPQQSKTEEEENREEVIKEFERVNNKVEHKATPKEKIIGEHLERFPKESFHRWGDANYVKDTPVIRMMYLGKNGQPIDVQARDMSLIMNPEGDGTDITPQDIVDFVMKFPRGKREFADLTKDDADQVAEQIIDDKPEFLTNPNLRYPLEMIDKHGLSPETLNDPAVQELISNDFVFDDADRENIRLIFEYAKTESGRQKLAELRAEQDQPAGESTSEGSGIPEVQGEQTEGKEEVSDDPPFLDTPQSESNQSVRVDTPAEHALQGSGDTSSAPRARKKATIPNTERKLQKLSRQIKSGKGDASSVAKHQKLTERLQRLKMKRYEGEQAGEAYKEPPLGATTRKSNIPRIPVSPIFGGQTKLLRDIVLDLSKGVKNQIFYSKSPIKGRRAGGSYNPGNAAIALKYKGNLDITAHELGHALDDQFAIVKGIPSQTQKDINKELKDLSVYGSQPPKGHPNPQRYRAAEGMAEYIRAYLVNPAKTATTFPHTTAWFNQTVPKETLDEINKFGSDIRTYAGLSAHDQIMSNVQFDAEKQKGGLASFFKPSSADKTNFRVTWIDRLAHKITNDKVFFNKAVDFLEQQQGQKLNPAQDPRILARVVAGSNEKLDSIFEKGLVNSKNKRVVDLRTNRRMNFEWLLQPFENAEADEIRKEQQEAMSYMIAERTMELANRFGRDNILTGVGAGIYRDTDVAARRLMEHDAQSDDKKARIEEAVRRYRAWADRVLRYMVDKGRMSQEQYEMIKADNTQYVALQRIQETAPGEEVVFYSGTGTGSVGSRKQVIKSIKGSSALIKNPYESLVETTIKAIKEADNNEVMQAFRELFTYNRRMGQGDPKHLAQIARPATAKDKNTVSVFVDGKQEYWQLDDDVYKSVKGIIEGVKDLPAGITLIPRMLRWSVTNFPVFAIRNRIRDIQQRMIVSDTKGFKGYDIYFDKKTKQLTKDMFELFGGGQAGYYLMNKDFYYKKLEEATAELSKKKDTIIVSPVKLAKAAGDGYSSLLNAAERATRLEEYRSAYKHGKSKGMDDYNAMIYAAYKSRDLLDFSVAGEYLRIINQLIPFSNAAVQGLRKTFNSAAEDPGGFAMRFLLYAVIPALLNRMLVHWWDKDEEYENFPNYRRDLFYNFPIGPDMWITIPKPFEIGVLSTGAERVLSKYAFDQKGAMDGYYSSIARSIWPVDDAAIAGPFRSLVEVTANYDFFRDQHIIPPDQVGLKLENRDTSKASRLGQALQAVTGTDARMMDHLVKSSASYFGDFAVRLSDLGREDSRNKFSWANIGLLRNDPLYDSKDVQWVLTFVKENGIHWSDPLYQEMNQMISTYYETGDKQERSEIAKSVREFARMVKEEYETNDYYRRENQVLEE
ncbi:MAG: hypothetical protein QM762_12770 [Chryseolinea sp.]